MKLEYITAFLLGVALMLILMGHGHSKQSRDAKLTRCFVYLPDMKDKTLRKWCLKQSERMP